MKPLPLVLLAFGFALALVAAVGMAGLVVFYLIK